VRGGDIAHSDGDTRLEERCPRQLRQCFLLGKRIGDMPGLALSILQLTPGKVEFGSLQSRFSRKGYKTPFFQEITGFLQHRVSFAKMAFEHGRLGLVHQRVRQVMTMSVELAEKGYRFGSQFVRFAGAIEAYQAEADLQGDFRSLRVKVLLLEDGAALIEE
jgi:hypothetical protein